MPLSYADILKRGTIKEARRPPPRQQAPLYRDKREVIENEASEARWPPRPLSRTESTRAPGRDGEPGHRHLSNNGVDHFSANTVKVNGQPHFQEISTSRRHYNNDYKPCVSSSRTYSPCAQKTWPYNEKGLQTPGPSQSIKPTIFTNQGPYQFQNRVSVDPKTRLVNWYASGFVFTRSRIDENEPTAEDAEKGVMSSYLTRPPGVGNFMYVYNYPPAGCRLESGPRSTLRAPEGCRRAVVMIGDTTTKQGVSGVGRGMGLVVRKMREELSSPGF